MTKAIKILITAIAILTISTLTYTTTLQSTTDYDTTIVEKQNPDNPSEKITEEKGSITPRYYLFINIECIVLGTIISLLITTSSFDKDIKESLNSGLKIATFILLALVVRTALQLPIYSIIKMEIDDQIESKKSKEEYAEGATISSDKTNIDLSAYNENITIRDEGEYTITGNYSHIINIDANGPVVLNLKSISVTNNFTGAVINNKTDKKLTVNLLDGTTNTLKSTSKGNVDIKGIITSKGDIAINGDGILNIETNNPLGYGIQSSNGSIEITSGIINIITPNIGIQHQISKDFDEEDSEVNIKEAKQVEIKGGSLYILAGKDAISSPKPVLIERGTTFIENKEISENEISFDIKEGTLIAINYEITGYVDNEKNPSNAVLLRFDTKKNPITEGKIITLYNVEKKNILSFITRTDAKIITISDKNYKIDDIISLYKDGTNNGILINNIYYNGNYVPGVDAIKNRNSYTIRNKISEYS